MARVYGFEKLEVWQLAMELIRAVYGLASRLPKTETFGIGDQLRRSSVSVALNIAEGRAADTDLEFRRFLGIALRSVVEVQACMRICLSLGMIDRGDADTTCESCDRLEAKLRVFKRRLTRNVLPNAKQRTSGVERQA